MSFIEIYKSLADESRLRLIRILQHGYFNVQELTNILGLTQSTISHHLKVLTNAEITEQHKEGTWVYYRLQNNGSAGAAGKIARDFLLAEEKHPDLKLSKVFSEDDQAREVVLTDRRKAGQAFFASVAKDWKDLRSEKVDDSSFLESIVERVEPEQRVLDLGCGSGVLLEHLAKKSSSTIGVDFSQAMLDEAEKTIKAKNCSCDLRLGYLEHLPVGDHSIDTAIAYMVLHHISEPQAALKDAYRVIVPEGKLLVLDLVTHNDESMRDRYGDLWLGFEPGIMQNWAKQIGFSEVSYDFFGSSKEVFLLTCIK